MAKPNLQKLDLKELRELQRDVETAIANFESRRRAEALQALEAAAQEHGFNLRQLVSGEKSNKKLVVPKYADPDNPSQTWSGRGRRPHWVVEALESGKGLEDLSI